MPAEAEHWFVNSRGPDTAALRSAFGWFDEQISLSPGRKGLLAISGKGNLEGAVETVIGSAAVKQLRKANATRTGRGTIELMTERLRPSSWSGPILAVYPTPRLLDIVDSLRSPTGVLVVPWLQEEVGPWIRTWSARELGSSAEPPPRQFSNATVRAALEVLTRRVNLTTGLAHPSDRAAAVEMFRLLRGARESFTADEVREWLVSELRWQPRHANDVAEIAERVLAGKAIRTSTAGGWARDAVERWRELGLRDSERA